VRNRTLRQKRALIESLAGKASTLLDVGCATGHFLAECKAHNWQVQGTEPDAGARAQAQEKVLPVVESIFDLAPEPTYKVVTLWHVLEHVHRLQETVAQLYSLVEPGGYLLIAVPNRLSYDAQKYGADWAAYDVPRHLYHFDPESLKSLTQQAGFSFIERKPMIFDAYYVSMLSERNRGGGLISAFLTGLQSNLKASSSGQSSSLIHIFKK
jgi:2-polyprenyl-3-methyl-5-hydroxy-6-metoxy-1,4-benzoquinol methylase